jgi:hypothetical protein
VRCFVRVRCVMLRDICISVLCLIVVQLSPGKSPFAVQINNNIEVRLVNLFNDYSPSA